MYLGGNRGGNDWLHQDGFDDGWGGGGGGFGGPGWGMQQDNQGWTGIPPTTTRFNFENQFIKAARTTKHATMNGSLVVLELSDTENLAKDGASSKRGIQRSSGQSM